MLTIGEWKKKEKKNNNQFFIKTDWGSPNPYYHNHQEMKREIKKLKNKINFSFLSKSHFRRQRWNWLSVFLLFFFSFCTELICSLIIFTLMSVWYCDERLSSFSFFFHRLFLCVKSAIGQIKIWALPSPWNPMVCQLWELIVFNENYTGLCFVLFCYCIFGALFIHKYLLIMLKFIKMLFKMVSNGVSINQKCIFISFVRQTNDITICLYLYDYCGKLSWLCPLSNVGIEITIQFLKSFLTSFLMWNANTAMEFIYADANHICWSSMLKFIEHICQVGVYVCLSVDMKQIGSGKK